MFVNWVSSVWKLKRRKIVIKQVIISFSLQHHLKSAMDFKQNSGFPDIVTIPLDSMLHFSDMFCSIHNFATARKSK